MTTLDEDIQALIDADNKLKSSDESERVEVKTDKTVKSDEDDKPELDEYNLPKEDKTEFMTEELVTETEDFA